MTPDGGRQHRLETGATAVLTAEPFEDTCLLHFAALAGVPGFVHAVTTRPWNMAPHRGPDADRAVERRRRVCEHLGLSLNRLTAPEQIHGGFVARVLPSDIGAGRDGRDSAVRSVDGLVCDLADVPVLQLSADCPLLLVVDPARRCFGTAHASWRGTAARIAEELVRRMTAEFGSRPADLLAAIGPCAGPRRYEVGEDVGRIIRMSMADGGRFLPSNARGRACLDLPAANAAQLTAAGILPDRVTASGLCTIEDDRFFSHRREGPETGRFALIAGFR